MRDAISEKQITVSDLVKYDKNGQPYSRPYLGKNKVTGQALRPYKRWPKGLSHDALERMALEWIEKQENVSRLGVSARAVELFISYVDVLEALGKPANTIKTYRTTINSYLKPNLGKLRIGDLNAVEIQGLYAVIQMQDSRKGGTISPNTVIRTHWFLKGAFKYLFDKGFCDFDPMPFVIKPDPITSEAIAYNEQEFAILNTHLEGIIREPADSKEAIRRRNVAFAAYLALWNGERIGEVLANSRTDAQLWRGIMHVGNTLVEGKEGLTRQPKTKGKRSRNISLYSDVTESIRSHYAWQESYLDCDLRDSELMICTCEDGKFMRPSDVSRIFSEVRDQLKLPKNTSFHTLRHTHATWLILNGADIVTVKERLGHAKESTTLELYGHAMPGRDAEAVNRFGVFADRAMGRGGDVR